MRKKRTRSKQDPPSSKYRRFSPEKQQEQLSLGQVQTTFSNWVINPIVRDLREDLLVQIYDDGQSTGLSFLMQLKSIQSLDKLIKQKSPQYAKYSLEIKDLMHWMDSIPPVVLVVWDVNQVRGLWQDIPSIVASLDKENPDWRKRKKGKITVELPVENTTDTAGRNALRIRIAFLGLPQLRQNKDLLISPTFVFPQTAEGRLAAEGLQKVIEEGGTTTVGGEYIERVAEFT